jgi:hypothetical protein
VIEAAPSGSTYDVWIGGAPDYGLGRLFTGNICHVAILTNALTSAEVAALFSAASQPILFTNISPLLSEVPVGTTMNLSAIAASGLPVSYQWSSESGIIPNATNAIYSFPALAGTNSYYLTASNANGTVVSSTSVVIGLTTSLPIITLTNAGWQLNAGGTYAGAPSLANGALELTDGGASELTSAFYYTAQYIDGFAASFLYTPSPETGAADGMTFCLQDSQSTSNALVGSLGVGGGLGYGGIAPSFAFEMDIYTHAALGGNAGPNGTVGPGIALGVNGSTPYSTTPAPTAGYYSTGAVSLTNNAPIYVQLYYINGVLNVSLVDQTKAEFTTNFAVNIPSILGNNAAYVGLTGGDGSVTSTQTVTEFTFSSTTVPVLTMTRGATHGTVVVSWPVTVSSLFQLLQAPSANGPWTVAATSPFPTSPDGTMNQVTVSASSRDSFYRLQLTAPNAP